MSCGSKARGHGCCAGASSNRVLTLVLAILLLGAAAPAAPALAGAGRWLAPVELLSGGTGAMGYAPASVAGKASVVLLRGPEYAGEDRVMVRDASGAWSGAEHVDPGASDVLLRAFINKAGEAVALWHRHSVYVRSLAAASRPAGGAWSAPTAVLADGPADPVQLDGAIDSAGNAVAVWLTGPGDIPYDRPAVQAAFRPAGGGWTQPEPVWMRPGPWVDAYELSVALDDSGNAFAAWNQNPNGVDGQVLASARSPLGVWEPAQRVSPHDEDCDLWKVTAHGQSGTTAVVRCDGGVVWLTTRQPGGTWGEPERLEPPVPEARVRQIVFNPHGAVAILWLPKPDKESGRWLEEEMFVTERAPGGPWSKPDYDIERVFGFMGAMAPSLRFDDSGNLLAVGPRPVDRSATGERRFDKVVMQAAVKLVGGPWVPLAESEPVLHPKLVADEDEPGVADDPQEEWIGFSPAIGSDRDALVISNGYDHARKGFADAYAYEGGATSAGRISSSNGFSFKAALTPRKVRSAANLRLVASQRVRKARAFKTIRLRFGSKPALRVRRSRIFASRAARRRGKAFGGLVLSPVRGPRVAALLIARRGRIEIDPKSPRSSTKRRKLRRTLRALRTKTVLRITRSGLKLTGLSREKYRRIRVSLWGRPSGLLRTPNRCLPIVFSGKFTRFAGDAVQAAARVPLRCQSPGAKSARGSHSER